MVQHTKIPDSRTVGDTNYSEYKFIKTGFKLIDNILRSFGIFIKRELDAHIVVFRLTQLSEREKLRKSDIFVLIRYIIKPLDRKSVV